MLPFNLESVNPCELEIDKKYDLGKGYYLLLKEETDDLTINDFDGYGTIQWGDTRPSNFDGSARIIMRDRQSKLWWMPYREGKKVYDDCMNKVKDILEYGFTYLNLSLYGPAQSIVGEHTVLIQSAGIGGIEPGANFVEYIKDYLIPDLQEKRF